MALFGMATWWVTAPGIDAGMSWTSEPPQATFMICRPRQIAKIGTPASMAARDERHLVLVPAGLRRDERLMRRLAEQLRVHVAASGEEQAADAAHHLGRIVVHRVEHTKLAAGALHGRLVVAHPCGRDDANDGHVYILAGTGMPIMSSARVSCAR